MPRRTPKLPCHYGYLGLSRAAGAFSLITVFFGVGQTLGPGAAGVLAEAGGTFTTSYLAAAALTGQAMALAVFLPIGGTEDRGLRTVPHGSAAHPRP